MSLLPLCLLGLLLLPLGDSLLSQLLLLFLIDTLAFNVIFSNTECSFEASIVDCLGSKAFVALIALYATPLGLTSLCATAANQTLTEFVDTFFNLCGWNALLLELVLQFQALNLDFAFSLVIQDGCIWCTMLDYRITNVIRPSKLFSRP